MQTSEVTIYNLQLIGMKIKKDGLDEEPSILDADESADSESSYWASDENSDDMFFVDVRYKVNVVKMV